MAAIKLHQHHRILEALQSGLKALRLNLKLDQTAGEAAPPNEDEDLAFDRELAAAKGAVGAPAAASTRPDSGSGSGASITKADLFKQYAGTGQVAEYLDALDRAGL